MTSIRLLKRLGLAAAGAAALALAPMSADAQETTKISFVQPSPSAINSFPVFMAIGEGYFAEEGLEVAVEALNGSASVLQAMSAGQADFGRPGPAPLLQARARGVDVVMIYNGAARTNFGVVVKQDAEYQKIEDLKGTTIGVGTADGAEVGFARNVLLGSGLKEGDDYEFLTVGDGGPATAAFERGDISAYAASTADAAILNQRGMPVRDITPDEYQSLFGNGLATLGDHIANKRDIVEKFGRAYAKGHAFALDDANREKVMEHLAAGNPQESEDPAFASALFDAVRSKTLPIDETKGLGYLPPETWETWQNSLLETGDLKEPLDLSKAYTNEFIEGWNEGLR